MPFPGYQLLMLAIESNKVIALRLMKIAKGGRGAKFESKRMVSEKIAAAIDAGTTVMAGGSASKFIKRYRKHVSSNVRRLSK
jgi:hypothetical protein